MIVGVIIMKLLKTKVWRWWDISILKWCCLFYGIAFGVYFHQALQSYLTLILVLAVLLTIRPAIAYWKD